ncbi:MAG: hypothetical protein J6M14_01490 [Campylobacter sp.]|nr:hypothetical protein [Campylobacter sp.]
MVWYSPPTSSLDFLIFAVLGFLLILYFIISSGKFWRFLIGFAIFVFTIALTLFGLNVIISTLIGGFLFMWYFATLKLIDNSGSQN